MFSWSGMMLGVIAIVKEEPIVEPSVMTDRASSVLVVALKETEAKARQIARPIHVDEELRRDEREQAP
jgi:hypothetical protein